MSLWDAGLSVEQIVARLGRADYLVRRTVSEYHDAGEETRARVAMRQCSDQLLAALQAVA